MCVSVSHANLSDTTLLINLANHPTLGEVFVLGYENTAMNLNPSGGGNAMILHLPAGQPMSQANFLDTRNARHILADMREAVIPRNRGSFEKGSLSFGADVQVFEYDIYTVVLAQNALQIPEVLRSGLVPADRMPDLNEALFAFYAKRYPLHSIALCCFNTREAKKAAPMLLYYHPLDAKMFVAPALDCHTGDIPNLNERVDVDHWVLASSYKMMGGSPVHYTDDVSALRDFLPTHVIGKHFVGAQKNGDFGLPAAYVEAGDMSVVHRLQPPEEFRI